MSGSSPRPDSDPSWRVSPRRRSLVVGVYAWMTAGALGMVLLDVSYAANLPAAQVAGALGEVQDLLLGFGAMTVVVGAGAIVGAWPWHNARYALLVSMALLVAELLAPALFSQAVLEAERAAGVRIGPWIRIGLSASASAAAFIGFWLSSRAQVPDRGRPAGP